MACSYIGAVSTLRWLFTIELQYQSRITSACCTASTFCEAKTSTLSPRALKGPKTVRSLFAVCSLLTQARNRDGIVVSGGPVGVTVPGVWDSHLGMPFGFVLDVADLILSITPDRMAMPMVPHPLVARLTILDGYHCHRLT